MSIPNPVRRYSNALFKTLLVATGLVAIVAAAMPIAGRDGPQASATSGYSFGTENSWIRIQNIGDDDANVELNYFDAQGHIAGTDSCPSATCPPMYPGSGWTFFQKDNTSLPFGFQGSAVISTDQPVVALLAKDVRRGDTFSIAGDTLNTGPGSHQIFLPVTGKRDGPNKDWNGRFVIQNMSDTVTACVTITYLSFYTDSEISWDPYKLPSSGKPDAPLPGCPNGGMPLPPRGSIFRDPDTMAVPNQFTGSVRIDLSTNADGQGPNQQWISASADIWNSDLASFGSYRGFDVNDLGKEIVLPEVDRQVGPSNSYSTRFTIVNKDPNQPADVTLRFDGYDQDGNLITKTNTFEVKGSKLCFQDLDNADCLADGDNLPFDFIGTAHLSSTEPIAVVVDRGTFLNDTFTDYRGMRPDQDAAYQVLLPDLNKNYASQAGVGNGWNSWFRVMVADGSTANVTVTYYGLDLPGGSASYTVPVNREFTVFQFNESMLPDGFAGTAIISSDKPIVALADVYTDLFHGDPDMVYNGTPLH